MASSEHTGDTLTYQLAELDPSPRVRPEDLERMKKPMGWINHSYIAYFQWMGNVLQGTWADPFPASRQSPG